MTEPTDADASILRGLPSHLTLNARISSGTQKPIYRAYDRNRGEEIAVMRDGRVVQRGTPDELYDSPLDTYVAGKIGSPHMNIVGARMRSDCSAANAATASMILENGARPARRSARTSSVMISGFTKRFRAGSKV